MMVKIRIKRANELENCSTYESIDEFIDNFPFAERQCTAQIERALERNGYYKFGDFDDPSRYVLTIQADESS
jgi:hypothetical protein